MTRRSPRCRFRSRKRMVAPPQPLFPRLQELTVDQETLFALASSNPNGAAATTPTKENTHTVSENEHQTPAPGTPIAPADTTPVAAPPIAIDDFMKVELR